MQNISTPTEPGDVELVTKKMILDFQLPPRSEPVGDEHYEPGEMASIAYDVAPILPQARLHADGIFTNDTMSRYCQTSRAGSAASMTAGC